MPILSDCKFFIITYFWIQWLNVSCDILWSVSVLYFFGRWAGISDFLVYRWCQIFDVFFVQTSFCRLFCNARRIEKGRNNGAAFLKMIRRWKQISRFASGSHTNFLLIWIVLFQIVDSKVGDMVLFLSVQESEGCASPTFKVIIKKMLGQKLYITTRRKCDSSSKSFHSLKLNIFKLFFTRRLLVSLPHKIYFFVEEKMSCNLLEIQGVLRSLI